MTQDRRVLVTGSVAGFSTVWTREADTIHGPFRDGAERAYANYGNSSVLDLDGVDAVLLISHHGVSVGGFAVRRIDPVECRLPLRAVGKVVQATAAWRDLECTATGSEGAKVVDVIAANALIGLCYSDAQFMVCRSDDHSTIPWVRGGADVVAPYESDEFPSAGYRTIPLVFERDSLGYRMDGRLLSLACEQMSTQAGWEVAAAVLRVALCRRRERLLRVGLRTTGGGCDE